MSDRPMNLLSPKEVRDKLGDMTDEQAQEWAERISQLAGLVVRQWLLREGAQ